MKVSKRMARKLVTIAKDSSVREAMDLMRKHSIRHLPVVEKRRKLVGLITEGDLRQAFYPSLLEDITIEDLMIKNPVTVTPETGLDAAARLIHNYKIGGLPVTENGKLVGMITITDILTAFIEIMGVLESSSRIDVILGKRTDAFEQVSRIITDNCGEIISVGMSSESKKDRRTYFFRIHRCDAHAVAKMLEKKGYQVTSVIA